MAGAGPGGPFFPTPDASEAALFGQTLSSKLAAAVASGPITPPAMLSSSESGSDNDSHAGSERSSLAATQKLQERFRFSRPLREAKLVFAEEYQRHGEKRHSLGLSEMRALIQKEQRKLKEEVTSMPYENTDMFDGDNSENEAFLVGDGDPSKDKIFERRPAWIKWALTALIGIVVSAQCAAMHQTEILLADFKQGVAQDLYNKGLGYVAVAGLLCYGLIAATLSAALVLFVSPRAASSGIPDTKAFLNGNRIPGFLSFKTWFARTTALMLVTSAGLFAGSEGPLLAHLGSIISSGLARGRFEVQGMRIKLPWKFSGHRVQAEFVSIGTAMGVAGAFGSPVGGLLFSMEEQSSFWSLELTWRTFFGCTISALFAKAAKNGFQSFPLVAFVDFPDTTANFKPWELMGFALIGLLTGLLGALFCKASFLIGKKRQTIFTKAKPRHKIRFAELMGLASCIILVCSLTPQLLGCRSLRKSWTPSDDGSFVGEQVRAHCSDGEYSDLATLVGQPKHAAIKALFTKNFSGGAELGALSLLIAYCFIFVFTLVANGMAMPYGLFVPHILSGACLGRVVGYIVMLVTGDHDVHQGVYAVVGAAGQLAGISRMTISLTMIMMEITMNMRLMLPLMLCIMVSKSVADRFTMSAFNVALELNKQINMLVESDWNDDDIDIPIFEVCSQEVVVLHCTERAKDIARVLSMTTHHSFPLVEGAKAHVCGVAGRKDLAVAVAKASGEEVVDLRPFADLTPEVKHWKTPASRVMTHFRVMGLTYLCIVDLDRGLMGIVTRSDISKISTPAGLKELRERADAQREKAQAAMFEEDEISPLPTRPMPIRRSYSSGSQVGSNADISSARSPRTTLIRKRSCSVPNLLDVQPVGGRGRSASIDAGVMTGVMPGMAPAMLPGRAPNYPSGGGRRRSASMDASFESTPLPLQPLEEQRPLRDYELQQLSSPTAISQMNPATNRFGKTASAPNLVQQLQQQQQQHTQPAQRLTLQVPAGMTPPLSSPAQSDDDASEPESSEGAGNDADAGKHSTREPSPEAEEQQAPSSNSSPQADFTDGPALGAATGAAASSPPEPPPTCDETEAAAPPLPQDQRASQPPRLPIEAVPRRPKREDPPPVVVERAGSTAAVEGPAQPASASAPLSAQSLPSSVVATLAPAPCQRAAAAPTTASQEVHSQEEGPSPQQAQEEAEDTVEVRAADPPQREETAAEAEAARVERVELPGSLGEMAGSASASGEGNPTPPSHGVAHNCDPPPVLPPKGPPPQQKRPFRRSPTPKKEEAEGAQEPQSGDPGNTGGTGSGSGLTAPATLPPLVAARRPSLRPATPLSQQPLQPALPAAQPPEAPPLSSPAPGANLPASAEAVKDGPSVEDGLPVHGAEAAQGADCLDI